MKVAFIIMGIVGVIAILALCGIMLYGWFWSNQFKDSF